MKRLAVLVPLFLLFGLAAPPGEAADCAAVRTQGDTLRSRVEVPDPTNYAATGDRRLFRLRLTVDANAGFISRGHLWNLVSHIDANAVCYGPHDVRDARTILDWI